MRNFLANSKGGIIILTIIIAAIIFIILGAFGLGGAIGGGIAGGGGYLIASAIRSALSPKSESEDLENGSDENSSST